MGHDTRRSGLLGRLRVPAPRDVFWWENRNEVRLRCGIKEPGERLSGSNGVGDPSRTRDSKVVSSCSQIFARDTHASQYRHTPQHKPETSRFVSELDKRTSIHFLRGVGISEVLLGVLLPGGLGTEIERTDCFPGSAWTVIGI